MSMQQNYAEDCKKPFLLYLPPYCLALNTGIVEHIHKIISPIYKISISSEKVWVLVFKMHIFCWNAKKPQNTKNPPTLPKQCALLLFLCKLPYAHFQLRGIIESRGSSEVSIKQKKKHFVYIWTTPSRHLAVANFFHLLIQAKPL